MSFEKAIALAIYFAAMLLIGLFAYRRSTSDLSEYMLGGRKVSPQVTALSAGASDMSGWMLMGLPGAMFVMGFETIWIALGLLFGAWANYSLVAPRLRVYTKAANDALTLPQFFGERFGKERSVLQITSAIVIILFFTLYTSAGLVAGGKLFQSTFALDYSLGVMLTAAVVVAYTLLGGFLAVSLTDFVQGCIMFVALILVPLVAYQYFNSGEELLRQSATQIPTFTRMLSDMTALGLISSLAWGLGYFGQPHIIVRFMAIRSVADIPMARNIGLGWMTVTVVGAVATGLVGVAYVSKYQLALNDPETIFILFSDILFNPYISGFLMAAILAAIMSTISSQLLVSSSSLTEDLFGALMHRALTQQQAVNLGRVCVAAVALVASMLALDSSNSVLGLVSNAWAGFGAAFGPVVLLALFWRRMTYAGAIAGIITGAVTVLCWSHLPLLADGQPLSSLIYEIIPGFLSAAVAIVVVSLLTRSPETQVIHTFKQVQQTVAVSR
ncbi:sodium/proline symporter PutP [Neiella sp. HB171785]|uniref:Sodium/proline symporter n=1 Tax=Neiella litorisoli TaxID=2771431 RepID=A0A8J6UI63_9GAMM|nr:sodium/proline symporter PutP [Neiella litorisoli]MBD1388158.1 sodium/proline symporter PutP [Neiella litorisoli]